MMESPTAPPPLGLSILETRSVSELAAFFSDICDELPRWSRARLSRRPLLGTLPTTATWSRDG